MLIKATSIDGGTILVGLNQVISIQSTTFKKLLNNYIVEPIECTKIECKAALVSTYYVKESVESIWKQYSKTIKSKSNEQ